MIDIHLESLTMRLVRCQNYAEPRTSAISQSKDAHSRHKINVGVILGLKTGQSHQPTSESFPLSHSSALFSSSSPFPSLSCYVLSFSNVFCCCDTQRCLLTNQNILAGAKIQHFQAMQTSVDLAKTQMIKKKKRFFLPLRLPWMPSFDSTLPLSALSLPPVPLSVHISCSFPAAPSL